LHNEIVASNGGDQNAALNELSNLGYQVFGLDGEPASREVIFREHITPVVAKAAGQFVRMVNSLRTDSWDNSFSRVANGIL
jgi:hypothetical protein